MGEKPQQSGGPDHEERMHREAFVGPQDKETTDAVFFFIMFYVYIIYSKSLDKFYVGFTMQSIEQRLFQHNNHIYGNNRYTSSANDWYLYHYILCSCKIQAINIERHIKRMKSRMYIHNLKKYPDITKNLKLKYLCT